jgi:RNA polymerase sigma-70 factor, ECF subfamily
VRQTVQESQANPAVHTGGPKAELETQRVTTEPHTTGEAMSQDAGEVTRLLTELSLGTTDAANRLATVVYDELHVIAKAAMRREEDGHTWQPTELVHEAFSRLVGQERVSWQNRHHFFGIAAQAMRRLLVDHARARKQLKRDGGERVTLTANIREVESSTVDILELNDALDQLAALDARQVRVVELRYFAGLSVEETAEALGISVATVKRDWTVARAFLRRALRDESLHG